MLSLSISPAFVEENKDCLVVVCYLNSDTEIESENFL